MPTIQVAIFFVGLALWSDQVPNDPGLHVILPQVQHVSTDPNTMQTARMGARAHTNNVLSGAQTSQPLGDTPHVENHSAAIITYTDSVDSTTNDWTRLGTTDFSYYPLNGEHVQFITAGNSNADTSNTALNMILPNVSGGPLNVAGATIVDVPPGAPKKSCLSKTKAEKPRLDATISLTTAANLIVSITSPTGATKQLQIKPHAGGIVLVVANIPTRTLINRDFHEHSASALEQVPHVNAYYAMVNSSCGTCVQKLKDWFLIHMEELEPCKFDVSVMAGIMPNTSCPQPPKIEDLTRELANNPQSEYTFSGTMQGANFMCSNETWP